MAGRMESTEIRQQQMMAFLARAVNNPAFLQQLLSARQTQRSLDNRGAFSSQHSRVLRPTMNVGRNATMTAAMFLMAHNTSHVSRAEVRAGAAAEI